MHGIRRRVVAVLAISSLFWGGLAGEARATDVKTASVDAWVLLGDEYPALYKAKATLAKGSVAANCAATLEPLWILPGELVHVNCYVHDAQTAGDQPVRFLTVPGFATSAVTGWTSVPPEGSYWLCMSARIDGFDRTYVGPDVCAPFNESATNIQEPGPVIELDDEASPGHGTAVVAGSTVIGSHAVQYSGAAQRLATAASEEAHFLSACSAQSADGRLTAARCWLRDVSTGQEVGTRNVATAGSANVRTDLVRAPAGGAYEYCVQARLTGGDLDPDTDDAIRGAEESNVQDVVGNLLEFNTTNSAGPVHCAALTTAS